MKQKITKIFLCTFIALLFISSPGQTDIVVDPSILDFGSVPIGLSSTMPIMVYNIGGSAVLNVTNITTNNAAFTVDTTAFVLAVGDSQEVNVTFSPVTPGSYYNFLYVYSDDPVMPVTPVILNGEAVEQPEISVFPDTFDVSLTAGELSTDTMKIYNTGITPLNYTIGIEGQVLEHVQAQIIRKEPTHQQRLKAVMRKRSVQSDQNYALAEDVPNPYKQFMLPDVIDGEEIFGSTASPWTGTLRDRGNIFQVTSSTTLTEHKMYLDIPTSTPMYFFLYEGAAVTGSFTKINEVFIASSGTGQGFYSSGPISVPLQVGLYYYIGASWQGTATYYRGTELVPIPCSFGFLETGIPGNIAGGYPPATTASNTYTNFSPYYCAIVTGAGSEWLSADPDTGMVMPGDSLEVEVTFNSGTLLGGDYYADLVINSNDPVNPELRAGAHLFVIGISSISADPDSLIFPTPMVVGVSDSLGLWIYNNGNGVLDITNIGSSNAVFSPSVSTLSVPPFDSLDITVAFTPSMAGTETGTLTLTSNDPATPNLDIYLEGEGIDAPVMVVTPDSFDVIVPSDTIITRLLNLNNSGNGPLFFNISITGEEEKIVPVDMMEDKFNLSTSAVGSLEKSEFAEASPFQSKPNSNFLIEAPWDLQFSFDLEIASGALGNAGAEFDGTYYYTTRWAANLIHKYDLAGNLVEEFSISGVTGLRDLAFDGTYMYGGANANTIFIMDFVSKTLVGTIPSPVAVRHIAYDETNVGLWVGGWADPPTLIDMNGLTLATLTSGLSGQYGTAYDGWSDGGPYLWIFDQGAGGGTPQLIHQFNLNTLTATGFSYDVSQDFPPDPNAIAGGLWIGTGVEPGLASIGGVLQGTPDWFFVYELAVGGANWLSVDTTAGTIPAMSNLDINVTFDPTGLLGGDYYANIIVSGNDPVAPIEIVPAHMFVDAEPDISTNPDSLTFGPIFEGNSETQILQVVNDAPGVLQVTDITSTSSVFTVDTSSFTVAPFSDFPVEVTFTPLDTGLFYGFLQIANNDPDTPVLDVAIEGTAIPAPVIAITPNFQNPVQVPPGDSADIFITIANSGGSDLTWSASISNTPVTMAPIPRPLFGPSEIPVAAELSPEIVAKSGGTYLEAIWDIQFSYDVTAVTTAAGNAGAEFDGTYYYSTRWQSNLLHKVDMSGNLVEEFSIPGVTGLRDLAFDGTFMYGGAAANTIYMMDFNSKTLIGTISSPEGVRHIAYDSDNDAFWVGNWTTDLFLVDRNGSTLSTIPSATHGTTSNYGTAYDNWSDGGPYLWIFSQGGGQGFPQFIYQIDLATGTQTGVSHEVKADFPVAGTNAIAGGLWTSEGIVSGKVSLGGILQGTPDIAFAYELTEAGAAWLQLIGTTSGTIAPMDQFDLLARVYGIGDPPDSAYVVIQSNDPNIPIVNELVSRLIITGIEDQLSLPTTYDIAQNYPNPFNPTTTIKYQLPQVTDVKLVIYNVLGQKVRTLLNNRTEAGYHSVVWDGLNQQGSMVASGIYIYHFEAGDFQKTMKLMLLK